MTVPPAETIERTPHVSVLVEVVAGIEVEDEDEAEEELVVLSPGMVVVGDDVEDVLDTDMEVDVLEPPTALDADGATATGRALTWLSAKLTICQVNAVVTARTTSHPATSLQVLIAPWSQPTSYEWVNGPSRNPQERSGSHRRR